MNVDELVAEYSGCRKKSAEAIVASSMITKKADEALNAEQKKEYREKLGLSETDYSRDLAIGNSEWLLSRLAELPDSRSTIYELTTLKKPEREEFVASGLLTQRLRRKDVEDFKKMRRDRARKPAPPSTRSESDEKPLNPVEEVEASSDEAVSPPSTVPNDGHASPVANNGRAPDPGPAVQAHEEGEALGLTAEMIDKSQKGPKHREHVIVRLF